MGCIGCGSAAVSERSERTVQGYRRFRCRACGKQFNERSAGYRRVHPLCEATAATGRPGGGIGGLVSDPSKLERWPDDAHHTEPCVTPSVRSGATGKRTDKSIG
jgi:hypothetical protein